LIGRIPDVSQTPGCHVLATFVVRFALPIALFVGVLQATPKEIENVPYFWAMAIGLMEIYFVALGVRNSLS
jgi:hypothetical protein